MAVQGSRRTTYDQSCAKPPSTMKPANRLEPDPEIVKKATVMKSLPFVQWAMPSSHPRSHTWRKRVVMKFPPEFSSSACGPRGAAIAVQGKKHFAMQLGFSFSSVMCRSDTGKALSDNRSHIRKQADSRPSPVFLQFQSRNRMLSDFKSTRHLLMRSELNRPNDGHRLAGKCSRNHPILELLSEESPIGCVCHAGRFSSGPTMSTWKRFSERV